MRDWRMYRYLVLCQDSSGIGRSGSWCGSLSWLLVWTCGGVAVLAPPFMPVGGAVLGVVAASVVGAEDVSEGDITKLNAIIQDYNTKVKEAVNKK